MVDDDYDTILGSLIPGHEDLLDMVTAVPVNESFIFSNIPAKRKKINNTVLQVSDYLFAEHEENLLHEIKKRMIHKIHEHESLLIDLLGSPGSDGNLKVTKGATAIVAALFCVRSKEASEKYSDDILEETHEELD